MRIIKKVLFWIMLFLINTNIGAFVVCGLYEDKIIIPGEEFNVKTYIDRYLNKI